METRLGPLRLASPVIGAAGTFGLAADTGRVSGQATLGAVVTSSVGLRDRPGRQVRVAETTAGALLIPGTERAGIRRALRRYARAWAESLCPVVVSVDGDSPEELAAAAAELEGVAGVAAIELPIVHPELVGESIRGVRRACALPVWPKLPPDAPELFDALDAAAVAGAAAATIGGGLRAATPDGRAGYLVGPATFPVVLEVVRRTAAHSGLPLIANGGVATAEQALAYLRAGAAAVQVGSAQLANPHAAAQIASAIAA